jgi:hypothetical protein
MVTRSELAALMTRYAGREVVAQDGGPSIALQDLPDASLRDGLLAMFADYSAHGGLAATAWLSAPSSAVPRVR